ncbi:MAG: stage III sporulation protein AF [Oscillospiraceae bacterium]|jgi:stage III sporulation protein AF|nr:stage III sporulation protein AF [Oscillospiraceae bacterium]
MATWWDDLRRLTALTLCATMVDLMMPSGSMRRYARLVSGLILMYTLLRPILALFTASLPDQDLLSALLGVTEGT